MPYNLSGARPGGKWEGREEGGKEARGFTGVTAAPLRTAARQRRGPARAASLRARIASRREAGKGPEGARAAQPRGTLPSPGQPGACSEGASREFCPFPKP